MTEEIIIAFNCGSSSLKFALFGFSDQDERLIARGEIENIGLSGGSSWLRHGAHKIERPFSCPNHTKAIAAVFALLKEHVSERPSSAGHRLVHGGPDHYLPTVVDAPLLDSLRRIIPFAPLHLPFELRCIEAVAAHFQNVRQVVSFDTAFHQHLPEVARRFALPKGLEVRGLHRYGFHGLSYEYIVETLGTQKMGRAVVAHLGSGASMVAIKNGKSIDTTMGLTPTGGLMMGTRTGDLDPGLLLFLLNDGYDASSLEDLVNHQAGLLGVSGSSSDMKVLLTKRDSDREAALAVEKFCYEARKSVGALVATLGGIDLLVFTGGIGQAAPAVRSQICEGLAHLGVQIDSARNAAGRSVISPDGATCTVHVVQTDEERMIARHVRRSR